MKQKIKKIRLSTAVKYVFLSIVSLSTIYPLFWIGISSLKTDSEIYGAPFSLPQSPKWSNYSEAWIAANVPKHMLNSMFYAVISVAIILVLSAMCAYVLAKVLPNPKIYSYFTLGIMVPVNSIIIPFILIFRNIGILNTRIGLILAFVVTNLAFSIFILVPFIKGIPNEIEESATIDGCSRTKTFVKIILPISKPGLATVGTFALINCWNDLFLSLLIVTKPDLLTLNLVCYNMRAQYVSKYGIITSAVMIMVIPVILLYALFQKQIVKGMTAGSVKG